MKNQKEYIMTSTSYQPCKYARYKIFYLTAKKEPSKHCKCCGQVTEHRLIFPEYVTYICNPEKEKTKEIIRRFNLNYKSSPYDCENCRSNNL